MSLDFWGNSAKQKKSILTDSIQKFNLEKQFFEKALRRSFTGSFHENPVSVNVIAFWIDQTFYDSLLLGNGKKHYKETISYYHLKY